MDSIYRIIYNEVEGGVVSPRLQAVYMDFDMLKGPLTAWELNCVEMGDNIFTDAHMEFDFIYVHSPHMTDLKSLFSNVKINSKSTGSVVFYPTFAHPILNERFLTSIKR